jgi:hypothetical protein
MIALEKPPVVFLATAASAAERSFWPHVGSHAI